MAPFVKFLGHIIDKDGIRPLPAKVRAVARPTSITELKPYLGLISYYGRFLPHLSTTLAPLYKLLSNGVDWYWSSVQEDAFKKSKESLISADLLIHFDPDLPLVLACDASAYGIGVISAHVMPDGTERPIAYASRTLEHNYSQIEKEGLSCVFGIKRFCVLPLWSSFYSHY